MLLLRPFLVLSLLAATLPHPARGAPASAQGADKDSAAKAHYMKGASLYRQGDYAGAWLEFTSAYQILPRAELLFNMARCEVKLGRPAEALAHFTSYLAAIPNDPDAAGLRKEMEGLRIEVAEIQKREAARAEAHPQGPAEREAAPARRPFPIYGTVAAGGTLLFGIIGAALLGSVNSHFSQLEATCGHSCFPEDVTPLRQQATAGYVFLGLTAAGAVTAAALLTWELRKPPERRLSLGYRRDASPFGRVVGSLSPGGGLGLGWRY